MEYSLNDAFAEGFCDVLPVVAGVLNVGVTVLKLDKGLLSVDTGGRTRVFSVINCT